ncbi:MAG: Rne/Rng family ribonuclease [Alphaproteobacteria bacterium]|uniref:Rne/Rng family ribonuclease n=1 Tax=Candidatus Nitrobium versatile TaxID=2884831 RepID=A0A953JEK7_9BACT|nr:Rne/Rng family ribonuclease [Candidatus Nitrobium versatile]
MTGELVINVTREESRVALLEGGQVVELYIERKRDASLVGNIYKGKVLKILPGMQSSFIDIGLEKAAFLYVADIMTDMGDYYSAFLDSEVVDQELYSRAEYVEKTFSIEELIQEGQELLVQVSKDPIGTKGARVTSYVTLPGRYVVLMPNVEHVGISRRIENEETRTLLKSIAAEVRPKGFGLIMRTACEDATIDEIRRDLEFLLLLWENIQKKKEKVSAPSLLYSDLDLVFRSVRDFMSHEVERLIIDSPDEYERLKDFARSYFPRLIDKIELYEGREPVFDAFGIELDISRVLGRRVWLKSGGYIVIDQTEAMTVIDVNTGKFVGKENLEDTILKTNLEAVKEIAYQIRLRNLGGIIITDFIDMEKAENREKVFKAFVEAMKKDRAKNTIYTISELGIIQMTRKRVRESLGRVLCEQCPYCEGRGFIKSARTVAYEIFRKVRKMNLASGTMAMIKANHAVAELLSDEERQGIEEIEEEYGIQLIIKEDIKLHQENYEITVL